MLFNSYSFILLFLPITIAGFYLLGMIKDPSRKYPKLWLHACSAIFLGINAPKALLVLWASIICNYFISKRIRNSSNKTIWLCLALLLNLGALGYFKYANFFIENINAITGANRSTLQLILPLGISFYTFTQMAFVIDTYKGITSEYSFLDHALFASLFPQITSGPITDHKKLISQFSKNTFAQFNIDNLSKGLAFFSIGLFKKAIIADWATQYVDLVFQNAGNIGFLEAWVGAIGYTLELYFDFSGYSDMVVGIGYMLGIEYPFNFDAPYQADSVKDFWRRWHITLGGWIRNYLYIPLGGNRKGKFRKYLNLLISMTLCGLWHGAGWTFVFWGFLHGAYLVINNIYTDLKLKLPKALGRITTFIAVVIGWVFFRASSFTEAASILHSMFNLSNIEIQKGGTLDSHLPALSRLPFINAVDIQVDFSALRVLPIILLLLAIVAFVPCSQKIVDKQLSSPKSSKLFALITGIMMSLAILALGHASGQFIYNNF